MAAGGLNSVLRHLCGVLHRQECAEVPDAELLRRYVGEGDEAAFEALVRRHGPMVLGVCRRVLPHPHDAEDAFQATFLVLVSKARTLRSPSTVSNWLYGVACRTAQHARHAAIKRRAKEAAMPARTATPDDPWAELLPLLDQELERLPEKYRAIIVLCALQGKTRKEAARLLGCAEGTVASRLSRGLNMLAKRLARYGRAVSAGALAGMLAERAMASVPRSIVSSTVKAAGLFAAGQTAVTGTISFKVAALTEGVLKTMLLNRLKTATVALLVMVGLGIGSTGILYQAQGVDQSPRLNGAEGDTASKPQKTKEQQGSQERKAEKKNADRPPAPADASFKDWPQSYLTGIVRDTDGKPIPGAKIHLNNREGPSATVGGNWAFSGADGKYALRVFVKPDNKAVVTEVIVSARGFVQLRERFLLEEAVLLPGKKTQANFVLARGEVLGGNIEMPVRGVDKVLGVKPEEREFALAVRGPSFKEYFHTEKGGRFEVWVPKGTYTVEVVGMGGRRAPMRRENVPSGSADLELAPTYARPSAEVLGKAFDALWDDMDRHYSYFALKKVDWKALKDRYRPRAVAAGDLPEFVDVLTEMLGHLRDGHVWVDFEGQIPTHISRFDGNYNPEVVWDALKGPAYCGNLAFVGVTKANGFGALVLNNQSRADKESVRQVVEFIRAHHDAPGFFVDLRNANGGNELLAQEIAREFCGKDAVYAKSKYRAGPGHGDFGPVYDRLLKAGAKPYTKPVVCLIGPRAVSSGEGFVQMMKCLPHVTTVGARTRGSSGNPKSFALPGVAVTVWYSRWVDLMPDGTPIEGVGIAPDIAVDASPDAYKEKDPTWDKAVEVLRKKVSPGPAK